MQGLSRAPKPGELWALVCLSPEEFWPALRLAVASTPAALPWLAGQIHGFGLEALAERDVAPLKRAAVAMRGVVFVRAPLDPRGGVDGSAVYLDYLDEVIEVAR